MESPVTIVKSAISPTAILKGIVGVLVVFAVFDLLGWTGYLISPVTALKAKFGTASAS